MLILDMLILYPLHSEEKSYLKIKIGARGSHAHLVIVRLKLEINFLEGGMVK